MIKYWVVYEVHSEKIVAICDTEDESKDVAWCSEEPCYYDEVELLKLLNMALIGKEYKEGE
jgi:hypothetical protein